MKNAANTEHSPAAILQARLFGEFFGLVPQAQVKKTEESRRKAKNPQNLTRFHTPFCVAVARKARYGETRRRKAENPEEKRKIFVLLPFFFCDQSDSSTSAEFQNGASRGKAEQNSACDA